MNKREKNVVVEVVVWPVESFMNELFSSFILYLFFAMGHWSGSRSLTTDNGLSLVLLLNIPMLSCVVEILLFWICDFIPFTWTSLS